MYLKSIEINSEGFPARDHFPFNVKVFQETRQIDISSPITFFAGENGSGKSALLDAIARRGGFLPWGGSKIHRAHHNPDEAQLANYISLRWNPRHPYGFYFRAEAFFNVAGSLDDILVDDPGRDVYFGGGSLNILSHGESFLAFFCGYSFQLDGLYLMDEPEAALSPRNQVQFVRMLLEAAQTGKRQYIVATHSPVILSCPNAQVLSFDTPSIQPVSFRETGSYTFYREFLNNPGRFFH